MIAEMSRGGEIAVMCIMGIMFVLAGIGKWQLRKKKLEDEKKKKDSN